jgi:hypothetical protein
MVLRCLMVGGKADGALTRIIQTADFARSPGKS